MVHPKVTRMAPPATESKVERPRIERGLSRIYG